MSYDPSHPTDKDRARYALGDTSNDAATELLTDDTIEAELADKGYAGGVAFLAGGLATRFAQQPSSVTDAGTSVTWGERVSAWQKLAAGQQAQAAQEAVERTVTSRARNVVVW